MPAVGVVSAAEVCAAEQGGAGDDSGDRVCRSRRGRDGRVDRLCTIDRAGCCGSTGRRFLATAQREEAGRSPSASLSSSRPGGCSATRQHRQFRNGYGSGNGCWSWSCGLEEIRLEMAAVKDEMFDLGRGDGLYAEAFRDYGADVDALDPNEAAEPAAGRSRLAVRSWPGSTTGHGSGGSPAARRIGTAGSDCRHGPGPQTGPVAEPGPDRLGEPGRSTPAALKDLVSTAPIDSVHPSFIVLLVEVLGERPEAFALLRDAQRRRPDDFWLNHMLTWLRRSNPPRIEEAIGFYRAALALRPNSPGVMLNLRKALADSGRTDKAIATYERTLRLKLDYAAAHNNLGIACLTKGAMDGAIRKRFGRRSASDPHTRTTTTTWAKRSDKGAMSEAATATREAIRLQPNEPRRPPQPGHNPLSDRHGGRGAEGISQGHSPQAE